MASLIIAPPPWSLNGNGVVLLYHFPAPFNKQFAFMQDYQREGYKGWIGAVMMVDYKASNVGPYQELLFIPGIFKLGGRLSFSISKIWVSTQESVWNGHNNWGIPKELAQFEVKEKNGKWVFKVEKENSIFFDATVKARNISLPFSSKLLPLSRISQQKEGQLLYTQISARGHVQPASLKSIYANPEYFPPINRLRPIVTLSVSDFLMQFPVAEVVGHE